MEKIYIGTSGWVYDHWKGVFYPPGLPASRRLEFYAERFKTTEINYSFYQLPRASAFAAWRSQAPGDFVFAAKLSRYITHIRRLKDFKESLDLFLKNAQGLKEKLAVILVQLPPSFKLSEDNLARLEKFLKYSSGKKTRFAVEFRNNSWEREEVYLLLRKYNCAWVIGDSPKLKTTPILTADFVYVRMHGSSVNKNSNYTNDELEELVGKIKKWQRQAKLIFVYFNNDAQGFAPQNASYLLALI